MNTVLILHGIEGHAGIHWQKWLHDELQKLGYRILMPTLPDPVRPDRTTCLKKVKALLKGINIEGLIIIGHSMGVVTALDYIEQAPTLGVGLISVSGFADDYGAQLNSYFMREKIIDFKKVKKNLTKSVVFFGDNDPYVPQTSLLLLAKNLGIEPVVIPHGGHLNTDAGYGKEFPLALESVITMTTIFSSTT